MNALQKLKELLVEKGVTLSETPNEMNMYDYINKPYTFTKEEKKIYLQNNFPISIVKDMEDEFFKHFEATFSDIVKEHVKEEIPEINGNIEEDYRFIDYYGKECDEIEIRKFDINYVLISRVVNLLFTSKFIDKKEVIDLIISKYDKLSCYDSDYSKAFIKAMEESPYKALLIFPCLLWNTHYGELDKLYMLLKHHILTVISDKDIHFKEDQLFSYLKLV